MAAAVLIKFPGGTPPCDIVAHAYDRAIYLDGSPSNFDFHLRIRRCAFYSCFYASATREKYPRSRNRLISPMGHLGIGQRGESAFESTAVTRRVDLSRLQGRRTTRQSRRLRTCTRLWSINGRDVALQPPCANTPYTIVRNVSGSIGCHPCFLRFVLLR